MLSRLRIAALLVLPTAAALVSATACDVGTIELGSNCPDWVTDECCPCPVPEACPDGSPPLPAHCFADGGDAGSEASADGESALCPGDCAPKPPDAWKGPVHVAIGAAISLAECPASLPNVVFEGQAAPEPWPLVCPTCSCDAPLESCELPTTWTVSSAPCNDPGSGVKTNLDPSAGWDGTCTTEDAIAAGKLCGGAPCVQSIAVSRPVLEQQPCVPHVDEPEFELPRFSGGPFATSVRACATDVQWPSCSDSALCVPQETGFSVCISHSGDETCPEGWNDKHVFYDAVDDLRFCEPCTCGLPKGGVCEIRYRIFDDSACSSELIAIKLSSAGDPNPCQDFSVAGVALASRTAEVLTYEPGACEPMGGTVAGEVVLSQPTTFCCLTPSS
ncbi:hypothetical protein KEG38_43255 [Polyangium jinanense]|uniref:hypothetical protein n=1 Tax=Polyangium jinanense TaxID=2829994 RepID=UPI002341B7EF|nr:hypothetical protein [Polyangium jinanense]MDC3960750.1 hypothetical protein [Polyangium jinanense]